MLRRLLFGDDVFISYSRADGSDYAAALAEALTRLKLGCRLDQWEAEPGIELPASLIHAVRNSTMLVVIGSPAAAASLHVRREVEEFRSTGRNMLVIDVSGAAQKAIWNDLVRGLPLRLEDYSHFERGIPSEPVLNRLKNSCLFTTRNRRLFRIAVATVLLIAVLIGIGAAGLYVAEQRRKTAAADADNERKNAQIAREEALAANQATQRAREEASTAKQDTQLAREEERITAQQVAAQRNELNSLELVRASAAISGKQWLALMGRALLAAEALKQAATPEAWTTVFEVLSLLPRPAGLLTGKHKAAVNSLAFSHDGRWMASGCGKGIVMLWETQSLMAKCNWDLRYPVTTLSFSPDAKRLVAAAGRDIHIWELSGGTLERQPSRRGIVDSLSFSADGKWLAVADGESDLRLFATSDWSESRRTSAPLAGRRIISAAFSPLGGTLALGGVPGVVLIDAATTRELADPDPRAVAYALLFAPDGRGLLVSTGTSVRYYRWLRAPEGAPGIASEWTAWTDPTHGKVGFLTLGPDGYPTAVVDSQNKTAWVLSGVGESEEISRIPVWGSQIAFRPGTAILAAGGDASGTIRFWDVSLGKALFRVGSSARAVQFSPNAQWLAVSGARFGRERNVVRVFRTGTDREVATLVLGEQEEVELMRFSPNGEVLAAGPRNAATLFQTGSWRRVRKPDAQTGAWLSAVSQESVDGEFDVRSPDGRWRARAPLRWDMTLTDVRTEKTVATHSPLASHEHIAISRDSRWLAAATSRGAYVLPLRPDDAVNGICALLPRNLTEQEWQSLVPSLPYRKVCPALPSSPSSLGHALRYEGTP